MKMSFNHQGSFTVVDMLEIKQDAPHHHRNDYTRPISFNYFQSFEGIFVTLVALPPKRSHDHKIILESNHHLVLVKPSWYPRLQEDDIERQVEETIQ